MNKKIRNFCIIAHIDHGKSTLADRLLEVTRTVEQRKMKAQLLDQMDIEQERGITIKLQPVRMEDEEYILNLIDTPGHVDFHYEVSRSLAACEGAVLVVDASQGIQAQTLANLHLAIEQGLEIIPVINKIDLPNAKPEQVAKEIASLLGGSEDEVIRVSAKTGENVEAVIDAIKDRIPAPEIYNDKKFRALIFDSVYDDFQGVVAYIRVAEGEIKRGDRVLLLSNKLELEVLEVGVFRPGKEKVDSLEAGEVGYLVTGLKEVKECRVGDTVAEDIEAKPLPGYKKVEPVVFASFYPVDADDYLDLREALNKLNLNDSSFVFEPESSPALGRGFRCGFLGLLHIEVIQERLKREYDLDLVITVPSVVYKVKFKDGKEKDIYSPAEFPDPSVIESVKEPWVKMEIITPSDYVGKVMELCQGYRGEYIDTEYLDQGRAILKYNVPLASIVTDFYDSLKGSTSGYASMSYEIEGYKESDLVKLDILIADDRVDAFSRIVVRDESYQVGKEMVKKLKDIIPRQNFAVALQAAIGGKIVARETLSAFRKDVTSGLYGGDVTRKRKLLEKQKKGKKRMKSAGKVDLPQEAFLSLLKHRE